MSYLNLIFISTSVNDWLKYSETKLITLFTVNGAALLGAAQILSFSTPEYIKWAIISFIGFSIACEIVCALGISPLLNPKKVTSRIVIDDTINILYFNDIAKCKSDEFLARYYIITGEPKSTPLDSYMASQIITNSRITVRKFKIYSWATRLIVYGIVIMALITVMGFFATI